MTERVEAHYSRLDLSGDISKADQLHTLGPVATAALAELAGIQAGEKVLDVGCGIGGPARQLARLGAVVTGIDLTPALCEAAREANRQAGLDIDIRQGSALALPFEDGFFDVVWTQHVSMNIEDKAGLFREMRRVVRDGGRLALFDVIAGSGEALDYPVPWADDASTSFLLDEAATRAAIEAAGFTPREWQDRTEQALAAQGGVARNRVVPGWEERVANHGRNLATGRIRLLMAVCDAG